MNATQHLEHLAIDAHHHGLGWSQFWSEHGADAIRQAEPWSRERFRQLVQRLLHLVCSGDASGMEPAGAPWLLDANIDAPKPSDTGTAARCLWPPNK